MHDTYYTDLNPTVTEIGNLSSEPYQKKHRALRMTWKEMPMMVHQIVMSVSHVRISSHCWWT